MPTSPSPLRHFLLAIVCGLLLASGATWTVSGQTLPLDGKASSLAFVGDAFLHSFHGEARNFTGSATLESGANPPVQKATLHFKTAALTTFHNGRDQKMWNCLHP